MQSLVRSSFGAARHEPGAKQVMGRRYDQEGMRQGQAVLADLAQHPRTARRVATQLARHFISDDPPTAVVSQLERTFRRTDGDLMALYQVLLEQPDVWAGQFGKMRRPYEFVLASARVLDLEPRPQQVIRALRLMGQPAFKPPSPKGWPDDASSWMAPDSLKTRLEWVQLIARKVPELRVDGLLRNSVGPLASRSLSLAVGAGGDG